MKNTQYNSVPLILTALLVTLRLDEIRHIQYWSIFLPLQIVFAFPTLGATFFWSYTFCRFAKIDLVKVYRTFNAED